MKIGFIGLGRMGHHVAANLLKAGHSVTVWNRSPDPVAALVAKGAVAAKTPADALQGDAVFSIAGDGPHDSRGGAFGPAVESLNLATTVALCTYELIRVAKIPTR
jgi:nucleoside-diphosphate-sugar epimerase